jgi:hypothetical protein
VSSFWAEHVWLPSGLARGVRLVVDDGRFVVVEPRATRHPEDVKLRGVVFPGWPMPMPCLPAGLRTHPV